MPAGGANWLLQQAMVPSVLTPQDEEAPTLTEVKVPAGGAAWGMRFVPQQAMVPSVRTPQK